MYVYKTILTSGDFTIMKIYTFNLFTFMKETKNLYKQTNFSIHKIYSNNNNKRTVNKYSVIKYQTFNILK